MKNLDKWTLRGNKYVALFIGFITVFPFMIFIVELNGYSIFMDIGNKFESWLGLCCSDVNIPGYLAMANGFLIGVTWLFYMVDVCMNSEIKLWKKPLWLISLFVVFIVAEIVYWFLHIWSPSVKSANDKLQPTAMNAVG